MLTKNSVKCLTHTSKCCLEIFLLTLFISTQTLALGGIGGGRSAKARNNNGVQAINAYICANLDCESSNVKIVEKCANKAHMEHGICQCDDGCIGDGTTCVDKICLAGQKPNSDNSACINCEAGQACSTCTDSTLPNGDGNGHCVCSGTSCGKNKYCASNGECQACATPTESCEIESDEKDSTTQCITTKKITCLNNQACIDNECITCIVGEDACCSQVYGSVWNGTGCECPLGSYEYGYGWMIYCTSCTDAERCNCPDEKVWDTAQQGCVAGCLSNTDCSAGSFCKMNPTSGFGLCKEILKLGDAGYTFSLDVMNWMNAQNWCGAQGKDLVDSPVEEDDFYRVEVNSYWGKSMDKDNAYIHCLHYPHENHRDGQVVANCGNISKNDSMPVMCGGQDCDLDTECNDYGWRCVENSCVHCTSEDVGQWCNCNSFSSWDGTQCHSYGLACASSGLVWNGSECVQGSLEVCQNLLENSNAIWNGTDCLYPSE